MSLTALNARRKAVAITAAALLLCLPLISVPAQGQEAPPSGFPSWEQVRQAKGNAAATAAEVAGIGQLLDGLGREADTLAGAAVAAGAALATTQQALDAANRDVERLNAHAVQARRAAASAKKDVAAVAVQSYKSGSSMGALSLLATLESPESLNGADLLHLVGERAALKQAGAASAAAVSEALEKSRELARAEQQKLAAQARKDSDAAVAASAAVTEQLNEKKTQSATLLAQLALLNDSTVALEAEYRQGQEAKAAYEQAQAAKREAAAHAAEEAARAEQDKAARPAPAAPKPVTPPVKPPVAPPVKPPVTPPVKPAPVDPDPDDGYIPVDVLLPNIPGGAVNDPAGAKNYAASRLAAFGWASSEFNCLNLLWERESNWRTNATNPYSGAYGIAQALPPGKYAVAGADWLTNYRTQVEWGLGYIKGRYGSPCGAWGHSQSVGWY